MEYFLHRFIMDIDSIFTVKLTLLISICASKALHDQVNLMSFLPERKFIAFVDCTRSVIVEYTAQLKKNLCIVQCLRGGNTNAYTEARRFMLTVSFLASLAFRTASTHDQK